MKNSEILTHLTALDNLKDIKFGGRISLILAKNKKNLQNAYDVLEDARRDMCEKVAEKDEQGKPKKEITNGIEKYVFLPDVNKKLEEDYADVLEQESDVVIEKINVAVIEQFSDITPKQADALLMFSE